MPDDARPTPPHDDLSDAEAREDLLARHALGATTDDEAATAERLVASDPDAAALAADYAALAAVLPAALADTLPHPPVPHDELKTRILAVASGQPLAHTTQHAARSTQHGFTPPASLASRRMRRERAGRFRAFVSWAAVVALTVTSVGLWSANRDLRRDAAPAQTAVAHAARSDRTYAMGGTAHAPAAHAVLFASPADGGRVVLLTSGFPPSAVGQVYRVWMRHDDGTHTAAGSFTCDGKGDATLVVPGSLAGVRAVTITAEPQAQPAAAPTGPVFMSGPLPPDEGR